MGKGDEKETGMKAHSYHRCAVKELVREGHLLLKEALDSVSCRKNQRETKLKVICPCGFELHLKKKKKVF